MINKLYTFSANTKIKEVSYTYTFPPVWPDACIGVDVIVGFPGETEEKFLETYHYLKELPISYLHVFTYSERDNTEANDMEGIIPINIRKERNKTNFNFIKLVFCRVYLQKVNKLGDLWASLL